MLDEKCLHWSRKSSGKWVGVALEGQQQALVVDDDPQIRRLLERILSRDHFAVEEASDGVEALEKIEQHSFDVILLDLMMPRMDGFEVVRRLQSMAPELTRRTIVITAFPEKAYEALGKICKVVSKPFDIMLLRQVVEDCVNGGPQILPC
ncbi:MAG: response regulator [Acidobacteriota bacterium]